MKRSLLYIMCMLIVALCMLACSQEKITKEDSYVDIEISTALEADYLGEGYSRSESGSEADYEVSDDIYDMRYTIELWSDDGSQVIYRAEDIVTDISQTLTHSFRAVAGEYRLVIFADYVVTEKGIVKESHYSISNGLDEITISDNSYTANDPSRDCYGYSEELIITSSFSLSGIVLKRPMAKMTLANIDPTDITDGSLVTISYGNTSPPCGYDLLNGEVIKGETLTANYPTTKANQIIAYDYIFISEPTSYLMTFKVGEREVCATINFEQNSITNITATFF